MIGKFKSSRRALEIFEHILNSQRIWLQRCGLYVEQVDNIAFSQLVTSLNQTWKGLIEDADLSAWVEYQDLLGNDQRTQFGDIVAHVINHGTYHRGQLRQLAEQDGIEFPDTDLILYVRSLQL